MLRFMPAVALLALCFAFTQFSDAAYWSAATFAGRRHTSAAAGVMNTGGSLPGLLAPLIGWMIDRQFDGTILPLAIAYVVGTAVAIAGWWWAVVATRQSEPAIAV